MAVFYCEKSLHLQSKMRQKFNLASYHQVTALALIIRTAFSALFVGAFAFAGHKIATHTLVIERQLWVGNFLFLSRRVAFSYVVFSNCHDSSAGTRAALYPELMRNGDNITLCHRLYLTRIFVVQPSCIRTFGYLENGLSPMLCIQLWHCASKLMASSYRKVLRHTNRRD